MEVGDGKRSQEFFASILRETDLLVLAMAEQLRCNAWCIPFGVIVIFSVDNMRSQSF